MKDKDEYLEKINNQLEKCEDLSTLDLIYQLLNKSV